MILDALSSIYTQTLAPNRVVIVVDDRHEIPHPWWREIVTAFRDVELLRNPGLGLASAITAGIRYTSSPYLAFLDTDDLWMPEKQARQVSALETADRVDAVTCSARNVWMSRPGQVPQPTAFPCATFTATTFRATTFRGFGLPDSTASHHTWLYRWWASAHRQGIRASHIDYLGLERRIHGDNSWCTDYAVAHQALLRELRSIIAVKGQAPNRSDSEFLPTSRRDR